MCPMTDWQSALNIREQTERSRAGGEALPGPFVTISRQAGCSGLTLGLLLAEILNDEAPPGKGWRVYGREILEQLAVETNLATEMIEELKARKPKLLVDFFQSLSGKKVPSGYEIRNRITGMVRGLAYKGYVIIVGQGAGGATADIENGLSLRLEAPLDWRVEQVVANEGCTPAEARLAIKTREKDREYLRKIYSMRFPREPAFDLTYDHSRFTTTQIARHVVYMMKLKQMV